MVSPIALLLSSSNALTAPIQPNSQPIAQPNSQPIAGPLSTSMMSRSAALSTPTPVTPPLTTSQFGQIPEIGLPEGRGITIQSATNNSLQTAQSVGTLKNGQKIFNGAMTPTDTFDYYRFEVTNTGSLSFLLSGLTPDLPGGLHLSIADDQGRIVSGLRSEGDGGTSKLISGSLRPGSYSLAVSAGLPQTNRYHLSFIEGNTYFVSASGTGQNLGTYAAPFTSIEEATKRVDPGDTILLRGGTYYQRILDLTKSGTIDRPITIQSVPGEQVILDHGLQTGPWEGIDNTKVFRSAPLIKNPAVDSIENILAVVVNNQPLTQAFTFESMTEGSFWIDAPSKLLYTWTPEGKNPTGQEVLVLAKRNDALSSGIRIFDGANHIVIDGISTRAADVGLWAASIQNPTIRGQGITLRNSEIKFTWNYGIRLENWQGAVIENNNIHNNAQVNYPRNPSGLWPHAVIGYSASDVTIKGNRIHDNHGEGVGPFVGSERWKIINNAVYDNWSINIYVDTDLGDVLVDGNWVYNTPSKYGTIYGKRTQDLSDGIRIANEPADLGKSDPNPGIYNIQVTNNVVTGTSGGVRYFPYRRGPSFLVNSLIANNTIGALLTVDDSLGEAITVNGGDNVLVANNLSLSAPIVLRKGLGTSGIVASNNWVPTPNLLQTSGTQITVNGTRSGDPNVLVGNGLLVENYAGGPDSPLYGAGLALPQVVTDYLGRPRSSSRPSIGAFQDSIIPVPEPQLQPQPQPQPQAQPLVQPQAQPPVQSQAQPQPSLPQPQPVNTGFQLTTSGSAIANRLRFGS